MTMTDIVRLSPQFSAIWPDIRNETAHQNYYLCSPDEAETIPRHVREEYIVVMATPEEAADYLAVLLGDSEREKVYSCLEKRNLL